jgi:hypothetical protein
MGVRKSVLPGPRKVCLPILANNSVKGGILLNFICYFLKLLDKVTHIQLNYMHLKKTLL